MQILIRFGEMKSYLIDGWWNFAKREEVFKLLAREITDTNASGEAKILTLLHAFPDCLHIHGNYLFFWNWGFSYVLGQSDWPMNQIHIHVVQLKIPAQIDNLLCKKV